MFKKKHASVIVVVVLMLVVTTVVYAAFVTVNTNNGAVDTAAWNSTTPLLVDGSGDTGNANYDIGEVWVANDAATPTELYFRVDLEGLLNLGDRLEARLDCNGDNDFIDAQDILVYYQMNITEDVSECQGNLYASGCPFALIEQNGAEFGEEITGTPNTYEWKADISGDTVWDSCMGSINVQFASLQNGSEIDVTDWAQGNYNVPTAVNMLGFTGPQSQLLVSLAAVLLGIVTLVGLAVLRLQKQK